MSSEIGSDKVSVRMSPTPDSKADAGSTRVIHRGGKTVGNGMPTRSPKPFDASVGVSRFSAIVGGILALTLLGMGFSRLWFSGIRNELHGMPENELLLEGIVFLSLGTTLFAVFRARAKESLILVGLLFVVLTLVFAPTQLGLLTGPAPVNLRPTWTAVFILLFVLLVPASTIYHAIWIVFASLCTPVWLAILVVTAPMGDSPRKLRYSPPVLGRRLLINMQPTWTCGIVGIGIAFYRERERKRWFTMIAQLKDAQGQLRQLGSYRLERRLGQGGMGEVWQATHQVLARPAAIKLMSPRFLEDHATDEGTLERHLHRFQQEAKLTARLTSPYTVQVYDYGRTDDGRLYYVMELLHGVDFSQLVRRLGPQPQERVATWMIQICDSLGEAHSLGLIHRDIKPANLFLCRQGVRQEVVKVLDFGLAGARLRKANKSGDTITGSPHFMAPEQIRDDLEVDGRSDLYALGCVAWYLLTGHHVFPEMADHTVLLSHLDEAPRRIETVCRQELHPHFAELINRLLAKDPNDRPSAAGVVADELLELGFIAPANGVLIPELLELDNDFLSGQTLVMVHPPEPAPERGQ